jgi:hypothetical protein
MNSFRRMAAAAAAIGLLVALAGPAAAASPVACAGAGWVAPNFATFESRTVGNTTQISFDFIGQHPLCLSNGGQVSGSVAGRLSEALGTDGSVGIHFAEILTYDGGTLGYSGDASFTGAGWHSSVRTNGDGTGVLTGIAGQGWFSPIDPNTGAFTDSISYTYH